MRIALDAMGGDEGPRPAIEGALLAAQRYDITIALVGKERILRKYLTALKVTDPRLEVVHAEDVIKMTDNPSQTLRRKQTSLAVATQLVKDGKADALVSAGNTGALIAHTLLSWRTLHGIKKPCLATFLPSMKDATLVVDAGATVDCKAHQIVQFAIMGNVYARDVLKRSNPRVGLLSNGHEDIKGNEVTKEANQMMRKTHLNFEGNAEGGDIFSGDFDLIACDGFVGNVTLKTAEGLAAMMFKALKEEARKSIFQTIFALLMKPTAMKLKRRTDYDEYGGAPLLGVKGIAIKAHGRSNKKAYMNALRVASECHNLNLVQRLGEELESLEKELGGPEAQPKQTQKTADDHDNTLEQA
ncbi:MAG: phosphate acyltransferase PlsX [Sumerlaeia bacterium]